MMKDVAYYLERGFDQKMAEYFASGRRQIVDVRPRQDRTLLLFFDNGEKRVLDCTAFMKEGTVFEPLLKWDNFSRVYLDDLHLVSWDLDPNVDSRKVWSNKVDLDADSCYVDSTPAEDKVP